MTFLKKVNLNDKILQKTGSNMYICLIPHNRKVFLNICYEYIAESHQRVGIILKGVF